MENKIIENITTYLQGEEIGSIAVKWDLSAAYEKEDWQVIKIHSIEFQIFDKVGVDLLPYFIGNKRLIDKLKEQLIKAIEFYSIYGLEQEVKDNLIFNK